jgi:CRP-like cAMP-binding protein/Fe-S-cluster-containing hydrogenase component 2
MAKKLMVMPPAELEDRDSDIRIPAERFLGLSFFKALKRKPGVERFPGTLKLRRYTEGDVICRQGEAGWTAFSVLGSEDALAVLQEQLQAAATDRDRRHLEAEIAALRQRLERAGNVKPPHPERRVATVYLVVAGKSAAARPTLLGRLFSGGRPAAESRPRYIPIDGPTDIPYETRQADVQEGDLFGEMSCLSGTPRSATVVADRDCYVLEMLRNILDELQKDEGYRARMDAVYRERILANHLRRLSVFADLTDEQFAQIRERVELVRCEGGELICDEHDRSDCMYVIRSGLVKVMKNASALLSAADVVSWPGLAAALQTAEQQPATPAGRVWQRLSEPGRALARKAAGLSGPEQTEFVYCLNDVLKDPGLSEAAEMQALPAYQEEAADLPKDRKKAPWTDRQVRRVNRRLLEAAFPGVLRSFHAQAGPETILAYRSRGDMIGEMGLMLRQPRSATCVAHVHPAPDQVHQAQGVAGKWREKELVELVRIPKDLFEQLVAANPEARARVEQEVAARQQSDIRRQQAPAWEEGGQVVLSQRFEELGLIQGQKLMLIDLDRCTRCDECVHACIDTHDDGRTRLFLDGPRFGKYLVPASCRSCLDPVCMIGCPVGSIHRGDNKQMLIRDWCIGCGLCAENCPYGSIQMHDIGLIPAGAHGWRHLPAAGLDGDRWTGLAYNDRKWQAGRTPFPLSATAGPGQAVCFRYEFQLPAEVARTAGQFKLEVTEAATAVWVNGQELKTDDRPRQTKLGAPLAAPGTKGLAYTITREMNVLRPGRNVVAVKAALPAAGQAVLDLRLDEVRQPPGSSAEVEVTEKPVTERAVVCDQCSSQYGQKPACVNACPHDAAMRVDARFEFPTGT